MSPRDTAPGQAPETSTPGADPQSAPAPGLRERGRLRRRVRYLRKLRELELRDLGGLVFDMYRFSSKRQDLVRAKLKVMFDHDAELRDVEARLGERKRIVEVREPGVGGACAACGTLHSSDARFCSGCGRPLGKDSEAAAPPEGEPHVVAVPAHATAQMPPADTETAVGPAASPDGEASPDTPTTEIGTARQ